MAVLIVKHEPKCKLCRHERASDIDALIERRSNLETDESGQRINLAYVLRVLGEWGIENPTEENIKGHWRKHRKKVTDEVAAAEQSATDEAVAAIWEGVSDEPADVEAALDRMMNLGMAQIEARVARGENPGIPPDLVVRIAAEKTKRRQNEATRDLLSVMAGGIAMALDPSKMKELDVIEGEFTEIEAA
jgi:hypothetical protein